jgi:hypothetical protein
MLCETVVSANPAHGEVYSIQHLVNKICQWLATGRWFYLGTPVSSINETDRHNITEILLKVAINTTKPNCSWQGVLDTTLCDKVCQWLATGRWFSPGTLVSFINEIYHHEITEIFLKVALTRTLTLTQIK